MEAKRLLNADGSWQALCDDWTQQCQSQDLLLDDYAPASLGVIKRFSESGSKDEWGIGIERDGKFLAVSCAIRAIQKGFTGHVLRISEVTVCPDLDYGVLLENDYIDTLIGILDGAVKLSESGLMAKHIKMHLRSPVDAGFFRAIGSTLDNRGVFADVSSHGAWITLSKR